MLRLTAGVGWSSRVSTVSSCCYFCSESTGSGADVLIGQTFGALVVGVFVMQ